MVELKVYHKHGDAKASTSCVQKTNRPIDKSQMYAVFIQCMKRDTIVEGNQIQKASLESCVNSRGITL